MPDYYAMLEVPANATLEQIKRSYRRLARVHHPDLNKKTLDTRIKQLNEAYEVLSDAERRAAYDALLLEELRQIARQQTLRRQNEERRRRENEQKMTWSEGFAGFVRELKKGMHDDEPSGL